VPGLFSWRSAPPPRLDTQARPIFDLIDEASGTGELVAPDSGVVLIIRRLNEHSLAIVPALDDVMGITRNEDSGGVAWPCGLLEKCEQPDYANAQFEISQLSGACF